GVSAADRPDGRQLAWPQRLRHRSLVTIATLGRRYQPRRDDGMGQRGRSAPRARSRIRPSHHEARRCRRARGAAQHRCDASHLNSGEPAAALWIQPAHLTYPTRGLPFPVPRCMKETTVPTTGRILIALSIFTLAAAAAAAQPAPFNEMGVTMGHWHIISKDVEANKRIFLAMGGKLFMPGGNPLIMFPGVYINLVLNAEKGDGGTEGSVINHGGFIFDNVQRRVAQWKASGVPVLPGLNNRQDQAFVVTPDGVRIEVLEDK